MQCRAFGGLALKRPTKLLGEVQAHDGAGELAQSRMGVDLSLEADARLAEARSPGSRVLDLLAITSELFTVYDTTLRATRPDAAFAWRLAALVVVVTLF